MNFSVRKMPWFLGLAVGLLVTAGNIAYFVQSFPGLAAEPDSVILNDHLPVQRDVYRVKPPDFIAALNLGSADLSINNLRPLPLLHYRSNDVLPLASLTKLMSALVILEARPDWSLVITIKSEDKRGGAKPRIFPGENISIGDLWRLMLVGSDNDATMALVRGLNLDETEFVKRMNQRALEFGLVSTKFVEPTGLLPDNVSTAREFAVIARAALFEPRISEALSLPSTDIKVNGESRKIFSSDQQFKSFRDARRDGWAYVTGKTGHLDEAGYNVALLARQDNGVEILAVLLGSSTLENRVVAADKLLAWAFAHAPQTVQQ
ncbi:hypothetical protein A3I40_02955 [Candidatus Uhrbacteria bacterium RIFCSPLOWO2_02_FULL_48_12]|uniref:Peptidase S11 D-alanyl-D-alanine carboxypeptidase A N-terminal domain-containing protein n=1 Tax=Candidatus Uhrbacteria bacterium RIFCSPLOWO2_02_FULL_48_12 TaxID=1802407 RepID=A0A1F7VAK7_9BACT|nr:MAG: hypothetical protein A3I40_02955 [Candidatus Uhrbacteria bacterium RIFCSPLOWO2_02_FULL_48_12]